MLYPQISGLRNTTHNNTWYVISAYIDMRPLAYGQTPSVTLVSAGPTDKVKAGASWFAYIVTLHTRIHVTHLQCEVAHYSLAHQDSTTHVVATIACAAAGKWESIRNLPQELGVCLVASLDVICDATSIIPVSIPPRYPKYPYQWADQYIEAGSKAENRPKRAIPAEIEYREGRGRIAICVPGVRGDQYVETFPFFLEYYHRLGVDAVFLYMHQPGSAFVDLVSKIITQQDLGETGRPELIVLPWCIQVGATFGCKQAQPKIQSTGSYGVAGSNYGQYLAHQDCLHRAFGAYRWVVYVDLDEFILPRQIEVSNLHDLIGRSLQGSPKHAPAEIRFRSAFYETCLPSVAENASVAISPSIRWNISDVCARVPKPMCSVSRISGIFGTNVRSKFICDPFGCDGVGVHKAASNFCARGTNKNMTPAWHLACETVIASPQDAILHHARVKPPDCRHSHVQDIDWTILNFSFERLGMRYDYLNISKFSQDH